MQEADYFWIMEAISRRKDQLIAKGMSAEDAEKQAREEYEMPEDDYE